MVLQETRVQRRLGLSPGPCSGLDHALWAADFLATVLETWGLARVEIEVTFLEFSLGIGLLGAAALAVVVLVACDGAVKPWCLAMKCLTSW